MLLLEKCKEKRSELRLSNAKIAELSNIPLSTVNSFFSEAVKNPSLITAAALCATLGISLDAHFGIEDPSMGNEELERIRAEYERHEAELTQKIDEHAQNILLHEVTIENNNETIRRQDLRMKELNNQNQGLSDRVDYQKKAITWLRLLCVGMFSYATLATVALIILLAK